MKSLLPRLIATMLATTIMAACAAPAAGLQADATYLGDLGINVRGGQTTGKGWSHLGRAGVLWSSASSEESPGHAARVSLMYMGGRGISLRSGDLQGLNNIEASRGLRLYELWGEAMLAAGLSLRGGFLDLNAEFDVPETAALFVSPPHGIGTEFAMSGRNGPAIWPASGLGLRMQGESAQLQWRLAAFEGEPGEPDAAPFARFRLTRDEGALVVGEVSWSPAGTNKLQVGTWFYTARFELADPAQAGQRKRGNRGAYALVDVPVAELGKVKIDGALRVGVAARRFNTVDHYIGAALAVAGFAESMPDDAIGIGIAHASTTPGWRAAVAADGGDPKSSETALELTWRHEFSDALAVLPHLHFVRNPGALYGLRDTWVVGLRLDAAITSILN